MLHADYQYSPKLLLPMAYMLSSGFFDVVLGSRILGIGALAGGMPLYKYVANRALTLVQNLLLGHKLSEYHTGYRGFTRAVIEALPLARNSDDFIFDNQMLAAGDLPALPDRRDFLPDEIFSGSLLHQLPPQRDLRTGRAAHQPRLPPGPDGLRARHDLRGVARLIEFESAPERQAQRLPLPGRGRVGVGVPRAMRKGPHPAAIASQTKQLLPTSPFRGRKSRHRPNTYSIEPLICAASHILKYSTTRFNKPEHGR